MKPSDDGILKYLLVFVVENDTAHSLICLSMSKSYFHQLQMLLSNSCCSFRVCCHAVLRPSKYFLSK